MRLLEYTTFLVLRRFFNTNLFDYLDLRFLLFDASCNTIFLSFQAFS